MFLKKIAESSGLIERLAEDVVRWKVWMPRMIDLEVTRVCNLKCPGCLRNAPSSLIYKEGEKHCTLDKLKAIMEEIPTLMTFNFMGDGEPLCNPEFGDLIHYISLRNINTIVTTNGTLLTKEIVDWWTKNKVYKVHVSVDGARKATYERYRVGAKFEKTTENLKLLGRSRITLCINMLIFEDNIEEMPEMVRLCKDVGAREVTFLMPICTLGSDLEDLVIRPKVTPRNYEVFDITRKLCKDLGINWIFPISLEPMFRKLNFPFIRPEISIEGDIYSCCYMIGRGKTWFDGQLVDIKSEDYILGNMFKEGFRNVWYSDSMNELRTTIKRTERKRGTIITREELRTMRENMPEGRFKYCEACLPRWGMACS